MRCNIGLEDRIGLLHPAADAHTLGIASVESLLFECGIWSCTAGSEICLAAVELPLETAVVSLRAWILSNKLSALGFSYRLNPQDGLAFFVRLQRFLTEQRLFASSGGPIKAVYFAGLPETCDLIEREYPGLAGFFRGDESPEESLAIFHLDRRLLPADFGAGLLYDEERLRFGKELVTRADYSKLAAPRREYATFGTARDNLMDRLAHARQYGTGPLMRAHVGPYTGDHAEDMRLFLDWTTRLAAAGLLDVLSIGTSQLTQSHFFKDRSGLPDGGGISIESSSEFVAIWKAARPMLVRTYAGSSDLLRLAWTYDDCLNAAWHTLSFWWFCKIDGRGPNGVYENLKEHFRVLSYIASTGKPFEPNVPHHFGFRGADDVTYVVSGFLAAKAAKLTGIRTLVLQIMLNTPKTTWGIQDLAKAQCLIALVRELEDEQFKVVLQPRGGLDYFSKDLEKAKIQLAAATALMDDLEPDDPCSPEIIHVVSYSEAVRLADPDIVNESIRLTRQALLDYRSLKSKGLTFNVAQDAELLMRRGELLADARMVVATIEEEIADPYSPEGFYQILAAGFLPVPHLWECRDEFAKAVRWQTRVIRGGVHVVDAEGHALKTAVRLAMIREELRSAGLGKVVAP